VRAQRHTQKEVWLENTLPNVVEGSKAHSKGGRVRKHTTHEVRARRRTQKEVWYGLKVHLKSNEVGLWSALPEMVEGSTARLKRDDGETPIWSNASWSIRMYTYLRNIGPLAFIEFSFSQKFESLIVSFDGSSALAYLSHILWSWPLRGISILVCPQTFIWKVVSSALYLMFSKKGNHGVSLMCFAGLPPSLIMSPSVQFRFFLGMRLYERRSGYLQGIVFMKNFWNFKAIPKNHFDVCSKQTCSEKFKRFSWIGLHECWKNLFCFWWSEVMFDWSKGFKLQF